MKEDSLENRIRKLEQQVEAERAKNKVSSGAKRNYSWKYLTFSCIGIVLIVAAIYLVWELAGNKNNEVPPTVQSAVNFPIYIPQQSKLMSGFSLNKASFVTRDGAVIYNVLGPNSTKIIFTLQKQPSASALQSFYNTRMPLTIPLTTQIGSAEIGNLLNEEVVSLPVTNGPWILITAPFNFNQSDLKQIVLSLVKS